MLAPSMYVCDYCSKIYHEKRLLLEIQVGIISQNGQISPSSDKTVHLCSQNDKCVIGWAKSINQKEMR
jgi:hypothetical protein